MFISDNLHSANNLMLEPRAKKRQRRLLLSTRTCKSLCHRFSLSSTAIYCLGRFFGRHRVIISKQTLKFAKMQTVSCILKFNSQSSASLGSCGENLESEMSLKYILCHIYCVVFPGSLKRGVRRKTTVVFLHIQKYRRSSLLY